MPILRPTPAALATVLLAPGLTCADVSAPSATVIELPAIVVIGRHKVSTATRTDEDTLRVPFASSIVHRNQLDNTAAGTLEEALRSVPGLQHGTQGNYYTRFETRGLRDTQDVLVLVDGVPLRILQGNADVTLIAPDLVERIEFIKGPASALYGKNAIGGVAQFFLRPEEEGGSLSFTAGSFGRLEGSYRQRWDYERGNAFIGLSYRHSDGFQRDTRRIQPSIVAGLDHALTSTWVTGLQFMHSRVKANRGSIIPLEDGKPMYGISRRDNFGIPGVYVEGDYNALSWRNKWTLSEQWTIAHLSSYARYDRDFQGGITIVPGPTAVTKGYSETATRDRGVFHDLSAIHRIAGTNWENTLQLGVNIERGWQRQASPTFTNAPTYSGPNYNTPVSNVGNDPRGIRGPLTTSWFSQEVNSVFVHDRLVIGTLGLSGGIRHDSFEQRLRRSNTTTISTQKASRTSPRVGMDWAMLTDEHATHVLFANYTEGFRPQTVALNTRSGVVIPSILRPERTRSIEAGFKGRAQDEAWAYQVSVFRADKIDGQRSYRNGPDSFVFSNATSRTDGIETQAQWRLDRNWSGYVHYTWQDARLRDFQTYDNAGNPTANWGGNRVRMSARHIAGAGIGYDRGPWQWSASANYVGSRMLRDNTANPQKLPAYTLINTVVGYRITPALLLQAGVNNLTDTYYIGDDFSAQEAGNAGAPRSFFVRVQQTF